MKNASTYQRRRTHIANQTDSDARKAQSASWRRALSPLLILPVGLVVLVTLLAPGDVLSSWAWLGRLVRATVAVFPWIAGHALSTSYPQVALLSAFLTLVFLPWTAAAWFALSIVDYPRLLCHQRRHRSVRWSSALFVTFIGAPIVVFGAFFAFAIPGDPAWASGMTIHRRSGYALVCAALLYCGGMVLGAIPLLFRLLIDIEFRKGKCDAVNE